MSKPVLYTLFFFILGASPLWAQEIAYDRYAPVWSEGPSKEKSSALGNFGKHFLVYPFEFVRWPIDQALLAVEEYHLDDKVDWIYEQLKNHGVTPKLRSPLGESFGGGAAIELVRLSGLKERFPHSTVEGSALWTTDSITDYRAKLLQEEIGGTGVRMGGNFQYENRGEEHFYGIGPNTSLGDGTSYQMERTTLELLSGYSFLDTWDAKGKFAFQNVNITNGEDGGRGIIDEIFVRQRNQTITGLGGDEIVSWALEVSHDNRDSQDLATEGGYERLHFSYHKGMESNAGYFKYRAEAAQFFKVFSERRAFGVRALVEHNDEVGDREVPFFDMARLGGYGKYPRYGDTHRGFNRDRFYDESLLLFNFEYRWVAYEYRDWAISPVLFCDVGQVFGEWTDFQFDDFKVSFGVGFRVSLEKDVVLELDIARSHEGFEFYAKTSTPF